MKRSPSGVPDALSVGDAAINSTVTCGALTFLAGAPDGAVCAPAPIGASDATTVTAQTEASGLTKMLPYEASSIAEVHESGSERDGHARRIIAGMTPDARQRPTRILVFVLTIVAARMVEMRTGWPDAVVLPLVALGALAVFDLFGTLEGQRLSARDWGLNAVFALLIGGLLWLLGG